MLLKDTVVVGLGNPLMSDEGVGLRVSQALAERAAEFPRVAFIDAGTVGMNAVHAIAGRRKAVFIDCAFMGEEPGAIRRFHPDDVISRKVMARMSLHEGNLLDAIDLSRRLGEVPDEVVIFGIQPEAVEMGQELSEPLRRRLDDYVTAVAQELRPGNADRA